MDKIHAFSLALGLADAGISDRELEARKNEARQMALAFMPSLRALITSSIEERLIAEGGSLWLAFDLVPTKQMCLPIDGMLPHGKLGMDITRRLRDDFSRLREEAGEFVVRTGRLTAFASRLQQLDADERAVAIESMPEEDRLTWDIMHHRAGRRLSVRFGDETLSAQLPLLNLFVPESTVRSISAKVSAICPKSFQLTSILDSTAGVSCVALPSMMKMDRPRQVVEPVRRSRFLLHVAEEAGVRVSIRVRAVLYQSDLSPAYLEFHGIDDPAPLLKALRLLGADSSLVGEGVVA